ncbi:MAG: T3SS effector HopA1 family protein [Spirosomataceae bacterium]
MATLLEEHIDIILNTIEHLSFDNDTYIIIFQNNIEEKIPRVTIPKIPNDWNEFLLGSEKNKEIKKKEIYNGVYKRKRIPSIKGSVFIIEELRKLNARSAFLFNDGWQFWFDDRFDNSKIVAYKGNEHRRLNAGEYFKVSSSRGDKAKPQDLLQVRTMWEDFKNPQNNNPLDYYFFFGLNNPFDYRDFAIQELLRFYFNIDVTEEKILRLLEFINYLLKTLENACIPFQFKLLVSLGTGTPFDGSADFAVLYVPQAYFPVFRFLLLDIYTKAADAELLYQGTNDTPLFTRRLAQGLAFAEEIDDEFRLSFGESRCKIVYEAIFKFLNKNPNPVGNWKKDLKRAILKKFERNKIKTHSPFLDRDSWFPYPSNNFWDMDWAIIASSQSENLKEPILAIGYMLCREVFQTKELNRVSWRRTDFAEKPTKDNTVFFLEQNAGLLLWDGASGIALVLSYIAVKQPIDSSEYKIFANAALSSVHQIIHKIERNPINEIGFYKGLTGIVYAIVKICKLLGIQDSQLKIDTLLSKLSESVGIMLASEKPDLSMDTGLAGCAIGLMKIQKELGNKKFEDLINQILSKIIQGKKPLDFESDTIPELVITFILASKEKEDFIKDLHKGVMDKSRKINKLRVLLSQSIFDELTTKIATDLFDEILEKEQAVITFLQTELPDDIAIPPFPVSYRQEDNSDIRFSLLFHIELASILQNKGIPLQYNVNKILELIHERFLSKNIIPYNAKREQNFVPGVADGVAGLGLVYLRCLYPNDVDSLFFFSL